SLGARRINEAVFDLVERWSDRDDVAVHHALGARDWTALGPRRPAPDKLQYQAVEYEERVPTLLSAADVWVGRAGGVTVAELTAVGVPSVLVPLPIAPHDHQGVGARRLAAAGACRVVPDPDCTGERLAAELAPLIASPAALDAMAAAAARAGHRDAADRIAELLEAHAAHVVGAGGAGMSAIATILASMGKRVTGSDLKDSAALRRLEGVGVEVHVGHRAANVGDVDAVAISTAVAWSNPEVQAARERGVPVLRRAELLQEICRERPTVAVAGTHGKTT